MQNRIRSSSTTVLRDNDENTAIVICVGPLLTAAPHLPYFIHAPVAFHCTSVSCVPAERHAPSWVISSQRLLTVSAPWVQSWCLLCVDWSSSMYGHYCCPLMAQRFCRVFFMKSLSWSCHWFIPVPDLWSVCTGAQCICRDQLHRMLLLLMVLAAVYVSHVMLSFHPSYLFLIFGRPYLVCFIARDLFFRLGLLGNCLQSIVVQKQWSWFVYFWSPSWFRSSLWVAVTVGNSFIMKDMRQYFHEHEGYKGDAEEE